jgi:hypothetical protein
VNTNFHDCEVWGAAEIHCAPWLAIPLRTTPQIGGSAPANPGFRRLVAETFREQLRSLLAFRSGQNLLRSESAPEIGGARFGRFISRMVRDGADPNRARSA